MSTDVERANELLRTWVGRTCEAFRREGDWLFVFSHGGSAPAPERPPDHADVAVWCAWRLIAEGRKRLFGRDINRRIVRCSGDDGHQFGHPAPVDAQAEAQKVIGESRVATVTIDAVTNDLEITFETGTVLQIVSNEDEVMIVTNGGKMIRIAMENVRVMSRNTQGVTLVRLDQDSDEHVVSVAPVVEKEPAGEEE